MHSKLYTAAALFCLGVPSVQGQTVHGKNGIVLPPPPATATSPVVDAYAGGSSAQTVKVTDNYRWLEDAKSPETRAYIAAQNAYTQQYLNQLKTLPQVREQWRICCVSTPSGPRSAAATGSSSPSVWRPKTRPPSTCGTACTAPTSG